MRIGEIELPDKALFLSPMENVSDYVFRGICAEYGADAVVTEFVNAKMLLANPSAFAGKMKLTGSGIPEGIQIYGKDPGRMAEAALIAQESGASFVDINFGCSVKKIASKGAGAGLLDHPQKMMQICRRVKDAVQIPVTAKTRTGTDEGNILIDSLVKGFQEEGLAAVFIHGRTREQLYRGSANWDLLGSLKRIPGINIPLIGNGDIVSPEMAVQFQDRSGLDGLMIGRGAIKHPWIFRDIKEFRSAKKYTVHTLDERIALLQRHIAANIEKADEKSGILHSRRFIASILKQANIDRDYFLQALKAENVDKLKSILGAITQKYGWQEFGYLSE